MTCSEWERESESLSLDYESDANQTHKHTHTHPPLHDYIDSTIHWFGMVGWYLDGQQVAIMSCMNLQIWLILEIVRTIR